jgi:hypothetical protein
MHFDAASARRTTKARVAILVLTAIASARSHAQQRPAIPEPACTHVSLVPLPGTGARRREIGLRITNDDRGDFPASIRPEIEVETNVGGTWRHASVAGFRVRANCLDAAASCVTLAPRQSVDVVAWTGMLGDGQCDCTRCAPAPAGRYRFVVTSCRECSVGVSATSPEFVLPPQ